MKRIVILCLSAILLAACFNFYGCKKCDCPTAPPTNTTEEIILQNTVFSPTEKMVTAGTTVKWINKDPYAHTVTSDDNVFNSGNMNEGQTFEYTFNTPGTYPYHCIYHAANMKGKITVH